MTRMPTMPGLGTKYQWTGAQALPSGWTSRCDGSSAEQRGPSASRSEL